MVKIIPVGHRERLRRWRLRPALRLARRIGKRVHTVGFEIVGQRTRTRPQQRNLLELAVRIAAPDVDGERRQSAGQPEADALRSRCAQGLHDHAVVRTLMQGHVTATTRKQAAGAVDVAPSGLRKLCGVRNDPYRRGHLVVPRPWRFGAHQAGTGKLKGVVVGADQIPDVGRRDPALDVIAVEERRQRMRLLAGNAPLIAPGTILAGPEGLAPLRRLLARFRRAEVARIVSRHDAHRRA